MTAVDDWLSNPAGKSVVLAELFPEEPLKGWTLSGGGGVMPTIVASSGDSFNGISDTGNYFSVDTTSRFNLAAFVAVFHFSSVAVSSVTVGGIAATLVDTVTSGAFRVSVYRVLGIPANDGLKYVRVIMGSTDPFQFQWFVLTDVHQTTPNGTVAKLTSSTGTPSIAVTSDATDMVLDWLAVLTNASGTAGAGQTERYDFYSSFLTSAFMTSNENGTAGTVTMSWTLTASGSCLHIGLPVKASPSSTVYQRVIDEVVGLDVTPGGMFCELVGVKENSTALTARANLADVQANAGSWYYDRAAKTMYVRATTGADPDTFTVFQVVRRVRLSTADPRFTDQPLFYPFLSGNVPELKDSVEQALTAQQPLTAGVIAASNTTKIFDKISRTWRWRNRRVELRFGGDDLPYADYLFIGSLLMVDVSAGDSLCSWRLRTGDIVDRGLPVMTWKQFFGVKPGNTETFADEVWYGYAPITIGNCRDVKLQYLHEYSPGFSQTYGVGTSSIPPTFTELRAVDKTTGQTTILQNLVDYYVASAGGIRISQTFPKETFDFYGDITTSSTWVTFADIATYVLELMGGGNYLTPGVYATERSFWFDGAAFEASKLHAPFALGLHVPGGPYPSAMALKVLGELAESVNARIFIDTNGRVSCKVWDPTADHVNATTLRDENIAVWNPRTKLESIVKTVRIYYDRKYSEGTFRTTESTSAEAQHEQATNDSLTIRTYLTNADDAALIRERYAARLSQPTTVIEVTEGLARKMMRSVAGDPVIVWRNRAPSETGRYESERFEIIEIRKTYSPTPRVVMTLGDMQGLRYRTKRWAPETLVGAHATWTLEEKRTYMAWSDDDGLIDGSNEHAFVWW